VAVGVKAEGEFPMPMPRASALSNHNPYRRIERINRNSQSKLWPVQRAVNVSRNNNGQTSILARDEMS